MRQVIGFTGTRHGMTPPQLKQVELILVDMGSYIVHHGDCVGADAQFHVLANAQGYRIIVHPPLSEQWRAFCVGNEMRTPKEYHARNRDIVDEADLMLAAPGEFQDPGHGGTWYTIRYAKKQKTPFTIILPDGTYEEH